MKIYYKYGRVIIPLWIPNSLAKSKRIQKAIHLEQYSDFITTTLIECKKYVKKYGHFTFVEVTTQDEGKEIEIIIKL